MSDYLESNPENVQPQKWTDDPEREKEMNDAVDRILEMNENGTMAYAITDDRGALSYFCKECQHIGEIPEDMDLEENYKPIKCEGCGSTKTSIGTNRGIHSHFRIKE